MIRPIETDGATLGSLWGLPYTVYGVHNYSSKRCTQFYEQPVATWKVFGDDKNDVKLWLLEYSFSSSDNLSQPCDNPCDDWWIKRTTWSYKVCMMNTCKMYSRTLWFSYETRSHLEVLLFSWLQKIVRYYLSQTIFQNYSTIKRMYLMLGHTIEMIKNRKILPAKKLSLIITRTLYWVPAVIRSTVQMFKFRLPIFLFGTNLAAIWKGLS